MTSMPVRQSTNNSLKKDGVTGLVFVIAGRRVNAEKCEYNLSILDETVKYLYST
jgi:hypothetical protein